MLTHITIEVALGVAILVAGAAFWLLRKRKRFLQAEYNKLRASVGMAPAPAGECYEEVAWVVVYDLNAPEVADECKSMPVEERDLFMMAYASYLSWLAMKGVESKFPADSWRLIARLLKREFSKQPWYQAEVMNRLFDSMVEFPWRGMKGKNTKMASGPWFEAVMATELAGFKLGYSTNMRFTVYVMVSSNQMLETIAKMAPKG